MQRFLVHRAAQRVVEGGKVFPVHAIVFLEAVEFEPVAGECLGKVDNAGILDHTTNLSPQLSGAVKLAGRRARSQLGIRRTRPEKITEATGQSRIGERH